MLTSGDVIDLSFGRPKGQTTGSPHPAVVVTAQRVLDAEPSVVQVVPLTPTLRGFYSEVAIEPDGHNGLEVRSAAQCQHLRAVSPARVVAARGNVGPGALTRIREMIVVVLDL